MLLLTNFQDFLTRNLAADNVCPILQNAMHLDAQDLVTRCFNVIDNSTRVVFNSESFLTIKVDTLKQIIERYSLVGASELEIFIGCVNWAEKECHRKGLGNSPTSICSVIGDVLPFVRFPLMPLDIFSNDVTPTEILTPEETLSVFLYLTRKGPNQGTPQPPFPITRRLMQQSGAKNVLTNCLYCGRRLNPRQQVMRNHSSLGCGRWLQ